MASKEKRGKMTERAGDFFSTPGVFYVESPTDDTVLVAVNPTYDTGSKTLFWWDSSHERAKIIDTLIRDGRDGSLQFLDAEKTMYTFTPLTLPIYEHKVRPKLIGRQHFDSLEEVIRAFEEATT